MSSQILLRVIRSGVTEIERVLRGAYEAFNARDIDAALALMLPEVDWPNAMQGGRVRGRDEVRAYWTRQFQVVDSRVEPQHFFTDEAGRIIVEVRQTVRDMAGNVRTTDTLGPGSYPACPSAGWNSSTGLPEGSSSRICDPPGPVTTSFDSVQVAGRGSAFGVESLRGLKRGSGFSGADPVLA
jgi:hypothetical protein